MSDSSSRSSSTDRVDGASIERAVDAYLERIMAGEGPELEPFAARLESEAARATFRVEALASEYLWRSDEGQSVSLERELERLPSEAERERLRDAVAAAREASRRLPWQLEVGARVGGGRYEITGELGKGGIGTVYAAFDRELQRPVAIKAMRVDPLRDAHEVAKSLIEESKALANLKSEHIVTVFDVLREGDRVAVVLDLVPGKSLADVVASVAEAAREGGSAERLTALRRAVGGEAGCAFERSWYRAVACLVARLAQAVARAHESGVLHRDLKPQNVMVQPDGEPVLLDFGLAHRLGREPTGERRFQGTPEYLAPEQVAAMETGEDPRTDVYALGLVLYELLALERAFPRGKDEALTAVLERIRRRRFTALAEHDRHVPVSLRAICERAMAAKPAERYASMAQMREDLQRYLEGLPPRYASVPRAHALGLKARRLVRNPLPAAALAVAILATWGIYEVQRQPVGLFVEYPVRYLPGGAGPPLRITTTFLPGDEALLGARLAGGGGEAVAYVFALYGDSEEDLLARPAKPYHLLKSTEDSAWTGWGLHVRRGDVIGCIKLDPIENRPLEGFQLFLFPEPVPAFDGLMAQLDEATDRNGGLGVAMATVEDLLRDAGARGGPITDADLPSFPPWEGREATGESSGYSYQRVFQVSNQ